MIGQFHPVYYGQFESEWAVTMFPVLPDLRNRILQVKGKSESELGGWAIEKSILDFICERFLSDSTILELGSGLGSYHLQKKFNLISIEHDPLYFVSHGNRQKCFYSPLRNGWYESWLVEYCLNYFAPSLVLVDGPPQPVRKNLLQHIYLFENYKNSVIFDDVNRKDDDLLCKEFCKKNSFDIEIVEGLSKSFAFCTPKL